MYFPQSNVPLIFFSVLHVEIINNLYLMDLKIATLLSYIFPFFVFHNL